MQKRIHQHEYSDSASARDTAHSQRGTALYLGLISLLTSGVALGLFACLAHLHIPSFSAGLIALAVAACLRLPQYAHTDGAHLAFGCAEYRVELSAHPVLETAVAPV